MVPVQSPSLMHAVPQAARHVAQLCTHENPQSQLPADVQLRPKLTQRPLLPPAPDTPEGVKTQPGVAVQVASVELMQLPSGVPTQFGLQKHPMMVAHEAAENAEVHV